MKSAIVLFNRDLRVHDHPALAEAHRVAEAVVPLFVLDDAILASPFSTPNKARFLLESLTHLRLALRHRGADLVLRRGDPVAETVTLARQVGAGSVLASGDVSAYAAARQARLGTACEEHRLNFTILPGATVVEPGTLKPSGADHYRVFTPFWQAWQQASWRPVAPTPRSLRLPEGLDPGRIPETGELVKGPPSPELAPGGEGAARD
ncbi:MAG: deoxyribodipyrimidine photo-lyase, partial [Acidimicrobiales bacterium]